METWTKESLREKLRKPNFQVVREHYLAYGFLRGRPYRALELRTRHKSVPITFMKDHLGCTVEELQVWFDVPATPEMVAHDDAARAAYRAAKAQHAKKILYERDTMQRLVAEKIEEQKAL